MAGPYYVDIGAPGAWNGRTGLDNGANCWLGISGLQKAFDTVTVGNGPVYIKGTGDVSKFYTVTYDASSGTTLTDGEEVTWDTGEGAWGDGTDKGIVRVATSTAGGSGTVEIELTTGTMPADNDVIKGTTSTQTITRAATANAVKTVDVDTNAGTNADGWIKFIGTNASWTVNGTRAILDANSAVINCITFTATADMLWFENIECQEAGAAKDGWNWSASDSRGFVLINCCAHNCGQYGFNGVSNRLYSSLFWRCASYSNQYGFVLGSSSEIIVAFSSAYDNSNSGFFGGLTYYGCIAHNNTEEGWTSFNSAGNSIINCVSHGNSDNGVEVAATSNLFFALVIGSRITGHSGAGDIGLMTNADPTVAAYCYFEGNTDNVNDEAAATYQFIPIENAATTSNINEANPDTVTDTDYGYVDSANHDFSTDYTDATDPTLRRTAITIPWT